MSHVVPACDLSLLMARDTLQSGDSIGVSIDDTARTKFYWHLIFFRNRLDKGGKLTVLCAQYVLDLKRNLSIQ